MWPATVDAIALLGPTASGQSALAMKLAREVALEIVTVDSAQVYRGLDVGSAKPTLAERAAVAHHLIDIRDPTEPYSAADFVVDAGQAIAAVRARGRLPLLVGGTMLYAKALRDGLSDLPPAQPALRARLEAEAKASGWPALHARLAELDPASAQRLRPNDSQRIQRALEICETTGQPMARLLGATAPARRLYTVGLLPADRAELHRRIEQRFDQMLAAGLLEEVTRLRARGDLHAALPALRSVGYRQAWRHLEGATSFAEFRQAGIAATRQLAKRQITWLRSFGADVVIDPFEADSFARFRQAVVQHSCSPPSVSL
jgi:tRNA dimethylallyltransferase